jgi:hypothetical protein
MKLSKTCSLLLAFLTAPSFVWPQACPKVTLTPSTQQTMQSLVFSVNCLIDTSEQARSNLAENPQRGLLVEGISITGAQHTRPYPNILFAVVAVPAGGTMKMSLATPDNPETKASSPASECKIRINPDNTIDAQCGTTSGTLFVVFHR